MVDARNFVPLLDDAAVTIGRSLAKGSADDAVALPAKKTTQKAPVAPAIDPIAATLDTVSEVGDKLVQGTIALEMGGMALGTAAGWLSLNKVKNAVTAPANFLSKTKVIKSAPENMGSLSSTIMDGSFALSSAVGAYHVALGYKEKCAALRAMCAEMMGKKIEDVPMGWVMGSNDAPKLVRDARSHIKSEHGWRGALQLGGVALNLRSLFKGGTGMVMGMINGMAPMLGSAAVDMVMGQSLVELYAPMSAAFKAKQEIPANIYANLLLAASHDLKTHGVMGQKVAMAIANKCAEQKIDPAVMLRKIENGEFAKVEIPAALKDVQAAAHAHPVTTVAKGSHAKPAERHVVGEGKFTGRLQKETSAPHSAPGVA